MRFRDLDRGRRWLAGGLVAALLALVTTSAFTAEGRPGSEVQNNDGGAWLLNRQAGAIGHFNREVLEVSSAVRVAAPGADFDVHQSEDLVLIHDRSTTRLMVFDGRTEHVRGDLLLPADAEVIAVDGGVVVYRPRPLTVWSLSDDELLGHTNLDEFTPDQEGTGKGVVAVGPLTGLVTHDAETGALSRPDRRLVTPVEQLSAAGATTLSSSGDRVAAITRTRVTEYSLQGAATPLMLQQPAVADGTAFVAADDGTVWALDLTDGTIAEGPKLDGGRPLPPIHHDGCLFTVVTEPPTFARLCPGSDGALGVSDSLALDGAGPDLRLRLVNGWVWINDLASGGAWVTNADASLARIDDWGAALSPFDAEEAEAMTEEGGGKAEVRVNPDVADAELRRADERDEDDENDPPVARDDHSSTRVDQPIVVPIIHNDEDPDGDVLLVEAVSDIAGTDGRAAVWITPDRRAVQVIPRAGQSGTISFRYRLSDGRGGTAEAHVTVEITGHDRNRPPEPATDVATTRQGSNTSVNVLANDIDPDGDALILTGVAPTDSGTVVHDASGRVTFTPHASTEAGRIVLAYTVADVRGGESEGRLVVAIRLAESNSPPDARNDSAVTSVNMPTRLDVLANDTDPDGDALIVARGNTHLDTDGVFTFTPSEPGTYLFDYVVSDGQATDEAQIRVEVIDTESNQPPVAVRDNVSVAPGGTVVVHALANDGDPDGDVVGIVGWTRVDGLDIEEVPGIGFRVSLDPDAASESVFRYSISDGRNEPVATTVVVIATDVGGQNHPPVAQADSAEVRPGRSTVVAVLANDHDPEGGSLEIIRATAGPLVTVVVSDDGQTLTVDVPANAQGDIVLSYDVADEEGSKSAATVELRVLGVGEPNRPPSARADVARTTIERSIDIAVISNDLDPDGDRMMTESVASQPSHGVAEQLADGSIRYSPDAGFTGTDRFSYVVVDTEGARSVGQVLVGVTEPASNRAPTARDDQFTVQSTSQLDVLANDVDPDGDPLTLVSYSEPTSGSLERVDGRLVYRPAERAETTTFSYVVSDGHGHEDEAVVTVVVRTERDPVPPVANDDQVGPVVAGQVVTVDVLSNDLDPDGDPTRLDVTVNDPAIEVDGSALIIQTGRASAQYRYAVTDLDGLTSSAVVTVFVVENGAPWTTGAQLDTDAKTSLDVDVATLADDPDDDTLYFVCCDDVIGGTAEIVTSAAGRLDIRYTPDEGFAGNGGFSYTVDDQAGHLVSGRVRVTVRSPTNQPPVAHGASVEIEAGASSPLSWSALGTDPDIGDEVTVALIGPAGEGIQVSEDPGQFVFTAAFDAAGTETTAAYRVTDGAGESAEAMIALTVTSVQAAPPSAVADQADTFQETPVEIDVLANDVDPLGQGLVITAVGDLYGGTVESGPTRSSPTNGLLTFRPHVGFFGTASFTYAVMDASNDDARRTTGQVTVGVIGRPDAPAPPLATAGNATATLVWATPTDNGSTVDDYRIELASTGNDNQSLLTGDTNTQLLSGLVNGDDYRFRLQAHNEAGWSEWGPWSTSVRPDTNPEAPSAPLVEFGEGELDVIWAPPANGGSPITGYRLELGGGDNQVIDLGSVTAHTWRNLRNGVEYAFRIAAVNDAGASSWSSWSRSEHPLREPDAPAAPVVVRGDEALDLAWNEPVDNGDGIVAYELEIRSTGRRVTVTGASTTTYQWGDLTNGQAQSFRVRATNRDPDPGTWSAWSAPIVPCGVPDSVVAPVPTRGDASVSLTWTASADQGCAVTTYQVEATSGVGTIIQNATARGGSAQGHTFTGLTNGTSYTFRIRALNSEGFGSWGASSGAATPAGPPSAPTSTTITPTAVGELTVTWSGATANGAAITHYERSINGGAVVDVGSSTSQTLTGLASGTSYDVRIRACNAVACSSWGPTRSATTWGAPSAPLQVAATASNASWTFSWSTPASDGGATLAAYEYRVNGGSVTRTTVRSVTVDPAANGTTYTGDVRACNTVGCGPWAAASATPTAPPPAVTVAPGAVYDGPDSCSGNCRWIQVHAINLPANTSVGVSCSDSVDANFKTVTSLTTATGTLSTTPCYMGYTGRTVWVTVNGVESNRIIWP